jgi:glutamate/tyrosine decarboxylase-like PLP-dependent enzyme
MVSIGEQGYLEATRGILDAAAKIKAGIAGIDGIEVIGDPLFNVAFRPSGGGLDIYRVLDEMSHRGWSLNGLQRPPALHICCTRRHAEPGIAERFLEDLGASVAAAHGEPAGDGGSAPLYGFAASLPDDQRSVISDFLAAYMDRWYRP